jgi:hypothetical protein
MSAWQSFWDRGAWSTYDGVGEMRFVPQIFSGMTRLATLLLPLGSAKLARSNLICIS